MQAKLKPAVTEAKGELDVPSSAASMAVPDPGTALQPATIILEEDHNALIATPGAAMKTLPSQPLRVRSLPFAGQHRLTAMHHDFKEALLGGIKGPTPEQVQSQILETSDKMAEANRLEVESIKCM